MVAVGAGLFQLGQMAAEDEAAQQRLAMALRNTVGATDAVIKSVEDQITKYQKVSTFTDDELRPAFQNLVSVTKDVEGANKMMGLAMDIAAARGLPLEQVSLALAKAHSGSVGALGRLGIATKDVEGKTLSFEQVMANANQVFGGQAQAATETTAGKMAILKRQLGELGETIGMAVLPIMAKLGDWLVKEGIPAIEALWVGSKDLRESLVGAFQAIWPVIQKAWSIVGPILVKWWEIQAKIIETAAKVIGVGSNIAGAVGGAIGKLPFLAHGGSFNGAAVVGEKGPELLVGSGTVIPNGGAGGTVINVTVSGVGMGRDFGKAVADAIRDNRLIGVT